jgi:hypothetical protein
MVEWFGNSSTEGTGDTLSGRTATFTTFDSDDGTEYVVQVTASGRNLRVTSIMDGTTAVTRTVNITATTTGGFWLDMVPAGGNALTRWVNGPAPAVGGVTSIQAGTATTGTVIATYAITERFLPQYANLPLDPRDTALFTTGAIWGAGTGRNGISAPYLRIKLSSPMTANSQFTIELTNAEFFFRGAVNTSSSLLWGVNYSNADGANLAGGVSTFNPAFGSFQTTPGVIQSSARGGTYTRHRALKGLQSGGITYNELRYTLVVDEIFPNRATVTVTEGRTT